MGGIARGGRGSSGEGESGGEDESGVRARMRVRVRSRRRARIALTGVATTAGSWKVKLCPGTTPGGTVTFMGPCGVLT